MFSKDTLLTNIMFYWAPNSAASAARLYYERRAEPEDLLTFPRVEVPTGVAFFPGDPFTPAGPLTRPRRFVEEQLNVMRWTDMPRGGHFAALEPQLLLEDVRAFFRTVR